MDLTITDTLGRHIHTGAQLLVKTWTHDTHGHIYTVTGTVPDAAGTLLTLHGPGPLLRISDRRATHEALLLTHPIISPPSPPTLPWADTLTKERQ